MELLKVISEGTTAHEHTEQQYKSKIIIFPPVKERDCCCGFHPSLVFM